MKSQDEILKIPNLKVTASGSDGGCGQIYLNGIKAKAAAIIWSNGEGWEHVSVSYNNRCPAWEEMCRVKEAFFEAEEVVIQYHPRRSEYVNNHPYCLHLWRKCGEDFETPPMILV